jgi:hypothetical protein
MSFNSEFKIQDPKKDKRMTRKEQERQLLLTEGSRAMIRQSVQRRKCEDGSTALRLAFVSLAGGKHEQRAEISEKEPTVCMTCALGALHSSLQCLTGFKFEVSTYLYTTCSISFELCIEVLGPALRHSKDKVCECPYLTYTAISQNHREIRCPSSTRRYDPIEWPRTLL